MDDSEDVKVKTCAYGSGQFQLTDKGVYFLGKDKDGIALPPQWICSPLYITAKTRDAKGGEWGRLLEWQDDDGNRHEWPMAQELLEGDGIEIRRELARLGVHISPSAAARNLLTAYIKVWPVEERARCVSRLGWLDGVYVTPSESIGDSDERIVFQNTYAIETGHATSGEVEQWRESVAAWAQGNSRLVFSICAAFAGPLLDIAGVDSGGFHFRGASSSGKSTALKMAASAWGDPPHYIKSWRSTLNGLEGQAVLHNDCILILDELGQADAYAAGDAAYLLANGQGKGRASRNGLARPPNQWQELFLSAGEESLSAIMEQAGKRSTAGQEIRLAEIDADAGAGMGIFEELHGHASAAALAGAIKDATDEFHGAVSLEWIRHLVRDRQELTGPVREAIKQFIADVVPKGAAGQVVRVAARFGLVAVAGELAARYGLTSWPEGEATRAARVCFISWLDGFGGAGNREERAILAQVMNFIEVHGNSRFEDLNSVADQRIPNRAGYRRTADDGAQEFLIPVDTFRKEVCRGVDAKTALAVLREAGSLIPGDDGKPSQVFRLPGLGISRVYVVRYEVATA